MKCHKERLFWTVSIELQAPRRLKTDVATAILAQPDSLYLSNLNSQAPRRVETPGRLETPRRLETLEPDFHTKNVRICDKYVSIWCHGGDHSKWSIFPFFLLFIRNTCERHVQAIRLGIWADLPAILGLSGPIFRQSWASMTGLEPILADLERYVGPSGRHLGPI